MLTKEQVQTLLRVLDREMDEVNDSPWPYAEERYDVHPRSLSDAVEALRKTIMEPRRFLSVRVDVTGMPDWEIACLAGEIEAQTESSDEYTEYTQAEYDALPEDEKWTGHRDAGPTTVEIQEDPA